MVLGTVQLGADYGINNATGKPSSDVCFSILNAAYSGGIYELDTAPAYGCSEQLIGQYHASHAHKFRVCTKLPVHMDLDCADRINTDTGNAIRKSLSTLGVDQISCYYLHRFHQCKNAELMRSLCAYKKLGLIEQVGISVYAPSELNYICCNLKEQVDLVQIPLNIFSLSQWADSINLAKSCGISIYVRSIFLQGLVFMDPSNTFVQTLGISDKVEFVRQLAAERNQSIAQLCYDAVAGFDGIEQILVGCETLEQLHSNLALVDNHKPLDTLDQQRVNDVMAGIPESALNPALWPSRN